MCVATVDDSAYTPDLGSAKEVMGTMQVDVLGRLPIEKKSVIHSWAGVLLLENDKHVNNYSSVLL